MAAALVSLALALATPPPPTAPAPRLASATHPRSSPWRGRRTGAHWRPRRSTASPDPWDAARGRRTFAAAGADGLATLRRAATAVRWPDAAAVDRLVAALDADGYRAREAADAELRRFARAHVPQLRAALRDAAPEAGQRLTAILESSRIPSGEELRAIRAVEVAEAVGGVEAAAVLAGWATGDGLLGREARAAVERMRQR